MDQRKGLPIVMRRIWNRELCTPWLAVAVLWGCQSGGTGNGHARRVDLADFSAAASAPAAGVESNNTALVQTPSHARNAQAAAGPPNATAGEGTDRNAVLPPAAGRVADSQRAPLRQMRPGEAVLVEGVIGQVSGTPIFADKFFEPIEDQLITEASKTDYAGFVAAARTIVINHLRAMVANQLFLAEAEESLTEEERKGLFYFVRQLQESVRNESEGQQSLADRRSRERFGMSAEERVQAIRDSSLINKLINERITPRVIVSWRDVENEYKLRQAEFNPPASVTLGLMTFNMPGDAQKLADAQARLTAGETFTAVAGSLGFRESGKWQTFQTGPGGIADIQVTDDIRAALQGLTQGQTTAPIKRVSSDPASPSERTLLIHVLKLEQPAGKSIYDVQHEIYTRLYEARAELERRRFIESIMAKGSYDEIDKMADRLLRMAIDRYGP